MLEVKGISVLRKLIQMFGKKAETNSEYLPFEVRLANMLSAHRAAAEIAGALSPSEIAATVQAQEALKNGTLVTLGWPSEAVSALKGLWQRNVTFKQFLAERDEAHRKAHNSGVRFSLMSPRWSLIFSDNFAKSIAKIDKKTQGRVLEVLTKISESPTTVVGDTVKPLTGDLKGLWRYRIGDYRLLYDPSLSDHHITLLSFEPRGDAY